MPKNSTLRNILPAKNGRNNLQHPEADSSASKRRKVSLACTECQKKKVKVGNIIPASGDGADPIQCSGTNPCIRCEAEERQCVYDPRRDRRRKSHTAALLDSHVALCRVTAKLRSGTPEEISRFIWEVQALPTDEEAVNYLVRPVEEQ
ncbi:hypothetical protein N7454_003249 [Penicillium verhagenii]|nr:hypothetical protein N7454_003249 [Penicillium verhagenii]